jgi:glycosyltransferase involved in cell wall biosynthesis
MKRTRVLRVIARLNVGGPALHATLLTERLDRARYDSRLVAGTEAPGEANYLALHGRSVDGLQVVPALSRRIRGGRDTVALVRLVRLMRAWRPDIVHTHTAKAGTIGRIAALLARVPIVVHTYHGHVLHGYFSAPQTRLFVAIERVLARSTTRLIAVSATVREDLLGLRIATPERLTVVPLGLDLDRFLTCERRRGELRGELGIGAGAPVAGIVARLVPIKAHEVFLEAAAAVRRRHPDAVFLIVGDGERRAELEALAGARGLDGSVRFTGWRRDLDRVYADLDVAVLCSRNEGSPVSLIEAMAAGRAVVATRVGGVPDLVEDRVTGCLVAPGDAAALGEAMSVLLRDRERAHSMGLQGRKSVYPTYTADRLVADIDALYTNLLTEVGR